VRFTEARSAADKHVLAGIAQAWGYPRELDELEIEASWWLRYGPGIAWLTPYDTDLQFHLVVDPANRGRFARFFLTGITVIGQLLGYERLVCFGEQTPEVASYLRRMGWAELEDEPGLAYPLEREEAPRGERHQEPASPVSRSR